ncbi:hypothetical protein [Pseudooceanicola atlanticus]|uniref:hypothetical protein n=1 Tax=Pseudooceanicola atlanticus TaxID=1461694 RepID=UPI0023553B02|nr:hypothetical protein [Pseudooceanicola atlanticus]
MPLIIYLDTQDYINLFNEPKDGPNHDVLNELLAFKERGEVVIGFSFATIVEFITKPDAANREERVQRGQLIKDICGPNAFPNMFDLARGATFPNGGQWMLGKGEKVMSASSFKRQMHKTLVEELSKTEGLNRNQRRQLGRKSSMHELMRRSTSNWGRRKSDYGGFPVSDEIVESRLLERFMKGQCTDAEFERRMNAWVSDPAEYSRIIYDYADHPNVIEKFFGKPIGEIEKLSVTVKEAVDGLKKLNEAQLATRVTLVDAGFEKSEARKLTKQFSLPVPREGHPKLEAAVGKERAGHFQHYFSKMLRPGFNFKPSDVMDLMQMCYAYECDLFRCDKAMASLFKDFAPFEEKLVGRFRELPDRITARLAATN